MAWLRGMQYVLRGVTQDNLKFYHVHEWQSDAWPTTGGRLYNQLKAQLLAARTLTEFQRMEKLLAAQALCGQKPSEMLHGDLVQFCTERESCRPGFYFSGTYFAKGCQLRSG